MEEPRRLKPEPPPLAAMKPDATRLPQRTQRNTKGTKTARIRNRRLHRFVAD